MTATTPCPLCGTSEVWPCAQHDRRGRPLVNVMCARCSLVRVDPLPTADELEVYYREVYRADYKGQRNPRPKHVWREFRRAADRARRLQDCAVAGARVLDVGSALGVLVATLRARGVEAVGLEPDAAYCDYSRRAWGLTIDNVFIRDFETAQRFDLVTVFHVLEHMPDFMATLRRVRGLLAPGGKLYVEVPDILATNASPRGRYHSAHVVGFSVATMTAALERAGFRVLECRKIRGFENLEAMAEVGEEREMVDVDASAAYRVLQSHTGVRYALGLSWLGRLVRRAVAHGREAWGLRGVRTSEDAERVVRKRWLGE
ncbi:MAG: class I SAM-dependent methyltransferase [Planctomycetota bacterium]